MALGNLLVVLQEGLAICFKRKDDLNVAVLLRGLKDGREDVQQNLEDAVLISVDVDVVLKITLLLDFNRQLQIFVVGNVQN